MAQKARTETINGSEQNQLGQHPSGQVVFPSHPSWPIYKASILPESSGNRPILQVDISQISTDWPQNLLYDQESYYDEPEEKREIDPRPPLKPDLSSEKRDFVIQFLKDAKPETLEKFFNLAVEEAGAVPSGMDTLKAAPTTPPRPADKPPLWAERTTGREVSPVDWIKMHYGNKDPDNWDPMGLTRGYVWASDRPLYQALGAWLSRSKQKSGFSYPEGMKEFLTSPTERLETELTKTGLERPQDAYTLFPDDPKKAERFRSALRRRV